MRRWASFFLVVAIIAREAAWIAKILMVVCVILFMVSLITG